MSLSTVQIIQLRAPQWANDPRISTYVAYVQSELSATVFGDDYNKAVALKILHYLSIEAKNAGNPGTGTNSGDGKGAEITSESEGQLSRSYNTQKNQQMTTLEEELSATTYGKELLSLMKTCVGLCGTTR